MDPFISALLIVIAVIVFAVVTIKLAMKIRRSRPPIDLANRPPSRSHGIKG
jgi:hypothetical protein